MKILIVGATGDVGAAICNALQDRHELIRVGRKSGTYQVDVFDPNSVQDMYENIGRIDAVVCAVGRVRFKHLSDHTPASMLFGLKRKVMGQINLVLFGLDNVADNGTFTLTSGILDQTPMRAGAAASTANAALAGFVKGASIEMPRGQRINAVGPGLLDASAKKYGKMFPHHAPVCSKRVGLAYARCVEGSFTGQVITVT